MYVYMCVYMYAGRDLYVLDKYSPTELHPQHKCFATVVIIGFVVTVHILYFDKRFDKCLVVQILYQNKGDL